MAGTEWGCTPARDARHVGTTGRDAPMTRNVGWHAGEGTGGTGPPSAQPVDQGGALLTPARITPLCGKWGTRRTMRRAQMPLGGTAELAWGRVSNP